MLIVSEAQPHNDMMVGNVPEIVVFELNLQESRRIALARFAMKEMGDGVRSISLEVNARWFPWAQVEEETIEDFLREQGESEFRMETQELKITHEGIMLVGVSEHHDRSDEVETPVILFEEIMAAKQTVKPYLIRT